MCISVCIWKHTLIYLYVYTIFLEGHRSASGPLFHETWMMGGDR